MCINKKPKTCESYPNWRTSLHEFQQLRLRCSWISKHQQINIASARQTIRQPEMTEKVILFTWFLMLLERKIFEWQSQDFIYF